MERHFICGSSETHEGSAGSGLPMLQVRREATQRTYSPGLLRLSVGMPPFPAWQSFEEAALRPREAGNISKDQLNFVYVASRSRSSSRGPGLPTIPKENSPIINT